MTLQIPANDHGAIYVFEVTGTPPAGLTEKNDVALMALFGPVVLNTDYVDVITPDMLADMSLSQLITQGYDMPVAEDVASMLNTLTGTAVLVMSAGFGGQDVTLNLPDNARLVTILREKSAIKVADRLTTTSAEGILAPEPAKPRKSDARMSGMIAMYALIFMFALVGLMIWVGG